MHPAILHMDISLKKFPVRLGSGSLGVRLSLDEMSTAALRADLLKSVVQTHLVVP